MSRSVIHSDHLPRFMIVSSEIIAASGCETSQLHASLCQAGSGGSAVRQFLHIRGASRKRRALGGLPDRRATRAWDPAQPCVQPSCANVPPVLRASDAGCVRLRPPARSPCTAPPPGPWRVARGSNGRIGRAALPRRALVTRASEATRRGSRRDRAARTRAGPVVFGWPYRTACERPGCASQVGLDHAVAVRG